MGILLTLSIILVIFTIIATYFYLYRLGRYIRLTHPDKYEEILAVKGNSLPFPFNGKKMQRSAGLGFGLFTVIFNYQGLLKNLADWIADPNIRKKIKVYNFLRYLNYLLLIIALLLLYRII